MDTAGNLSDFFEDSEFAGDASPDDIFGILEALDDFNQTAAPAFSGETAAGKDNDGGGVRELLSETEVEGSNSLSPPRNCKRQKSSAATAAVPDDVNPSSDEQQPRMSHITVERNRRKQMNGHLSVLRSLMPCFYVKRGDQASIIGGVVDYITELQQVVESLEAKKQRKVYNEVLLSPRKPALSPRMSSYPISPTTPQPTTSYGAACRPPLLPTPTTGFLSSSSSSSAASQLIIEPPSSCSPTATSSASVDSANELAANSKSEIAEVEVKFSGANVVVKTVSPRIPGQAVKIISALEDLSLEILHVSISVINDHTMLNSFTIKIGIECQLSAEELAQQIQQTFC
ncbi:PREDICTED: transcription factor SPEECHLESS-like [Ipomoea nil]|uniref:transcription factor SPEECHLESS-like n=1 Tax=Ipomoea nil TaxID=35883 RepID=UPI000900DD0D|nr:PREDICTED: transcription factor SPEECHLESS-like [Ipomoea nil]